MFKGNSSIKIETSKSKEEVYKILEEQLEVLGRTSIASSGTITISESKLSGFSYKVEFDGRIKERDGTFLIDLDFNTKPDILAWIIGICLFPIGFAIFILPYNAKGEINKKADRILDDINFDLGKK